eukprot:10156971-Alexandrium_andersonii.AAC.1
MAPRRDREDGPGERLSHSQEVKAKVVKELEGFRYRWWLKFNQWVQERIEDDYNPGQWSDDVE